MQVRRAPELWYDSAQHRICEWGGWPDLNDTVYPFWCATLESDGVVSWSSEPAPESGTTILLPTFASAWTYSGSALYSLSGLLAVPSSIQYVNTTITGLVELTFDDQSWQNMSSAGASGNGLNVFGEAAHISQYGDAGIFMVLGGQDPSTQSYDYAHADDSTFVAMSEIGLFDLGSQKWYYQPATGSIPKPRGRFCMVGASAPDNATYEM